MPGSMTERYAKFRQNPFVNSIATTKKWTVSTNTKMPIDMFIFKYRQQIKGALFTDDTSLTTLDEVNELIPNAANYAFYLDAITDKFVVLDIEPTCPDEIKAKLQAMPCLYCETSMSGKGIHMVFRLPEDILMKYPEAQNKIVFKEEHKYYEILLNHYVTFTANQLPFSHENNPEPFRKLFEEMARTQKETVKTEIDISAITEKPGGPYTDLILETLMSHRKEYKKTLSDFYDDNSKYEFAYIAFLYNRLQKMTEIPNIKARYAYTDSEKAWFLYTVATEYLPYRAKHDESRNNLPWLLYLSGEVIAHNKNQKKNKKEKKQP